MEENNIVSDREYMNMIIKEELAIRKQLVKLYEKVESNVGKGSQELKKFNEKMYLGLHKSIQDLDDNMHWTFDLWGF